MVSVMILGNFDKFSAKMAIFLKVIVVCKMAENAVKFVTIFLQRIFFQIIGIIIESLEIKKCPICHI
jgi:hypothetical protein